MIFLRSPILLLSWLALWVATAPRAQALEFTALGGLNYAAPTQRAAGVDVRWTGNAAFSYGLAVSTSILELPFDFETGVFVLHESSDNDTAGTGTGPQRKMHLLQIPFLVRFNFDEHIGLGMGGYVGFGQGEIESTTSGVTTSSSYEAASLSRTDAGLLVNIRARFDLAPPFYFILDGRYQHGLRDRSLSSSDLYNTRSVQAFAGFQFKLL